jgi:hypothetical protein
MPLSVIRAVHPDARIPLRVKKAVTAYRADSGAATLAANQRLTLLAVISGGHYTLYETQDEHGDRYYVPAGWVEIERRLPCPG